MPIFNAERITLPEGGEVGWGLLFMQNFGVILQIIVVLCCQAITINNRLVWSRRVHCHMVVGFTTTVKPALVTTSIKQ